MAPTVPPATKWYEWRVFDESAATAAAASVDNNTKKPKKKIVRYDQQRVRELREEANRLLVADLDAYYSRQTRRKLRGGPDGGGGDGDGSGGGDDWQWIRQVLKSGTLADKLSAHTLLLQDSPVHNLKSLQQMVGMVSPKAKRECLLAMDTLRDLFIGDLLIPDGKLRTFQELIQYYDDDSNNNNKSVNNKQSDSEKSAKTKETNRKKSRKRQLIICLFEDQLKSLYRQFIDAVVSVGKDTTLETTKHKSLLAVFDLLVNNGEQEQLLLSQLCNRLGDPLPKLAAQAMHLLSQLINRHHPFMKPVVVDEVERILFRPNITPKAQYYGLCFLTEIMFDRNADADRQLANKLVRLYFGFFQSCCRRGDIQNKMMSVLLTGVSRAFPYSKLPPTVMDDHLQTFYKLIHYVEVNTAIQALCLIFNILDVQQTGHLTDRFYTVLYRHLLDVPLDTCSRRAMLLNLVYKAMKKDPIVRRVKAFVKRLLQLALTHSSSLATAILILVSEVIRSRPGLLTASEAFLNMDDNQHHNINNNKTNKKNGVKNNTEDNDNESDNNDDNDDDDDDDEHYEDVLLSDDDVDDDNKVVNNDDDSDRHEQQQQQPSVSWVHNKNMDTNRTKSTHYDLSARNPLYASAESTGLWELNSLCRHYHPSTELFAEKILANKPVDYSGDPLNDFTVKHFLDRFVFRNPKKMSNKRSSKESRIFGRVPNRTTTKSGPTAVGTAAADNDITSADYLNQPESRVSVDERFIYNYLRQRKVLRKEMGGADDSDADSVTSVEFDRLLDRLEPMSRREQRGHDFAKDLLNKKKASKKKKSKSSDDDEEDSDDDSMDELNDGGSDFGADDDDDEEVDFDADNDPDFADAFGDIDDDMEEALGGVDDDDDDDEDRDGKKSLLLKKRPKQGVDRMTNSLFASADEFAELLEDNELDNDDSDDSGGGGNDKDGKGRPVKGGGRKGGSDRKQEFRAKRKLSRKYQRNKKRPKVNVKDLL